MEFYRYWTAVEETFEDAEGKQRLRRAYGYSNEDLAHALEVAQERASHFVNHPDLRGTRRTDEYYPTDRAIREQIIEEFHDGDQRMVVISRNSYGCLVLNTPDVFFADVDLPLPGGCLGALFGASGTKTSDFEKRLLDNMGQVVGRHQEIGLRLYRTAQGYRIAVTSDVIPATEARSMKLLDELEADRTYVSLCRSQDCYRARLSPKPWRCGIEKPPARFPFLGPGDEAKFEQWRNQYEAKSHEWATCAIVGNLGSQRMHPRVESVLKLHDHYALNDDKPLA